MPGRSGSPVAPTAATYHDPMQKVPSLPSSCARWTVWLALAAAPLVLAACGSTTSPSNSPGGSPSPSSGATPNATGGSGGGLDLAKLGVLTNYSATMTDNGQLTETYRVHSPTDWEVFVGKPTPLSVNLGGSTYADVPTVSGASVTYSWQATGSAQPYAQSPYPSYASGFAALTHVTGSELVEGGTCSQAGIAGRLWHFAAAAPGAVFPHVSACIADQTGALLTYDQAPIQTFAITGVNDVPAIPVP